MISANEKRNRRQAHHLRVDQIERSLGMTDFGKGMFAIARSGQIKRTMGATPAQLRAASKQIAQRQASMARRPR